MPTTFRYLRWLALIVALIWAGLWALATYTEPQPRTITLTVPIPQEAR